MKNSRGFSITLFLIDFLLLNTAFFMVHYLGQRTFRVSGPHGNIMIAIFVLWVPIFFLAKKHRLEIYRRYQRAVLIYIKSALFLAYGLSFVIIFFSLGAASRFQVFGTCLAWLVFELLALTLFHISFGKRWGFRPIPRMQRMSWKRPISPFFLLSDLLLFVVSFFLVNLLKRGSFRLIPYYPELLILSFGFWIALSFFTRKYDRTNFRSFYFALAGCIKTALLMGAVVSVAIFAFRLFYFSRFQIFSTLSLLLVLEIGLYSLYFLLKFDKNHSEDIESVEDLRRFFGQEALPLKKTTPNGSPSPLPSHMKILMDTCIDNFPGLFEFIRETVDISNLDSAEIALLNCREQTCFDVLQERSFQLVINFQKTNGIRWLNRYFLGIHRKLLNGGYFVGKLETLDQHKKRFFQAYPEYYRELFYIVYFLVHRVMPKLPQTRKVYFAFTKGRSRSISRAEALGRLYFCGFKVLAEREINGSLFFIAQKSKTPSLDKSPTYSPIIRLRRVGWNGQVIQIFKFRTMHPYSEYLQEYIYEQNQLKEGGKIKDDFRVTEWGRLFRKYWLDELPMIYNWLRGDIKLFGVRPLSQHYLSLYDASVQNIRKWIKPGLIPPYYADMPKEFEDIVASEKRYIESYRRHPWRTQWGYLARTLNNILLKGARSE